MEDFGRDREIYPIGVVERLTGLPQRYLRELERRGVLTPGRSPKNRRLYSENDLRKLRQIFYLGVLRRVNVAGIKEVFALLDALPPRERERALARLDAAGSGSGDPPGAPQKEAALEDRPGMVEELAGEAP